VVQDGFTTEDTENTERTVRLISMPARLWF